MFTMRLTARSCPTIFPKSRRSKSSTAGLRISGSRSTSSETNGLTIALHLLPVFPSLCQESLESASTLSPASRLPIKFRLLESLTAVPYIRWEWLFLYAVIGIRMADFSGCFEWTQQCGDTDLHIAKRSCLRKIFEWHVLVRPCSFLREYWVSAVLGGS